MRAGLTKGPRVWDALADAIDGRIERHVSNATRTERWKVLLLAPPTFGQIQGDLVLEEGDPDLEITQWVRKYNATTGLAIGDVVLVHFSENEYSVYDVVSEGAP